MVSGVDVCGLEYSAQLTEATKAAWGGLDGRSYMCAGRGIIQVYQKQCFLNFSHLGSHQSLMISRRINCSLGTNFRSRILRLKMLRLTFQTPTRMEPSENTFSFY